MKKTILAGIVAVLLTGCGSLTGISTAKIKFTDGTNTWSITQPKNVSLKDLKVNPKTGEFSVARYTSSPNVEIANAQADMEKARVESTSATFKDGFQQGINGLRVYTGQGGGIQQQNAAPTFTQEQVDEAIRRYQIRASNSTQATVTEVKPK